MHKPIIFYDMEGTLFRKSTIAVDGRVSPSAWNALHHTLGPVAEAEGREGMRRWNTGEFAGFVEWVDYAVEIFKRHKLTREMFERVLHSIEFNPGVLEVFDALRGKYRTALISGGLKAQADIAQKTLKINHAFAACELFWNDDGSLAHWNSLPCDYEGKVDFMGLIMKEHKVDPKDCYFVGDGINDVLLAQAVGTSIAFNGHPDLQKVATHQINQPEGQEDFRAVLEFMRSLLSRETQKS